MASNPAGKRPATPKTTPSKPAAAKKRAGVAASAKKPPQKREAKAAAEKKDSSTSNADKALSPKQQRFVDEYLVDLNATQAAIRAGYSRDTAGSIGHENLKKPEIQAAISIARKAQQDRTGITADHE